MKSWRRKLAGWLDPEMGMEAESVAALRAQKAATNRVLDIVTREREVARLDAQDARNRLANAGVSIAHHMKEAAVLRNALRAALPYVQDASDEIGNELLKLAPKSKKRAGVIATLEAVQADIRKINAALEQKAPENGQPLTLTNEVAS